MSELSFNEIRNLLEQSLNAGISDISLNKGYWIIDVYSNWFVYQDYANSGTFKRDYAIGTDKKVTLGDPVSVVESKTYITVQTAAFDLNGDYEETDEEIIIEGKIFEAGEFPDKKYSMTPEEILTAVEKFTPQDVDDSHNERSVFKGKMGKIREVFTPDNGQSLHAKVGIAKWVDKAMGAIPRTVSCTWDRATKTLAGLALTTTPRIKDAVLYAAFIEDQEAKQKQAEFEGKRNSATDHKTIQGIHDHTMSLGAKCSGDNAEYSVDPNKDNKELPTMSEETKVEFKDSAEFKAQQTEIENMRAEVERMKTDKRHSEAVLTVEELLRTGKAVPAERASLIAAFEQAATDDAKNPSKVTFGEGQEGTRVDALKAVYAARPAHVLFGETVPVGGSVLYSHQQVDQNAVNKAKVRELLALSPLGQAVLEDEKA
jgi:hypothetical protein